MRGPLDLGPKTAESVGASSSSSHGGSAAVVSVPRLRNGAPRKGSCAVEVTALIRDFGSPRAPIRAVDNLDLSVHTGEIYGFLRDPGPVRAAAA